MERDAGNGVKYWLSVEQQFEEALYPLRAWSHLKIAREDKLIWVRGLLTAEINSVTVLSLPTARRYFVEKTKLVPYGRRLPYRVEPSLLWTPIQRGLPVRLPAENFNYFGITQQHEITIVPSAQERPVSASVIALDILADYVKSAPAIRMKPLSWTVLDQQQALIVGMPILPVRGEDYYQRGQFLVPVGWRLKYENLTRLYERALADGIPSWYLIDRENKIHKIKKANFNRLSKGAVVKTITALEDISESPAIG